MVICTRWFSILVYRAHPRAYILFRLYEPFRLKSNRLWVHSPKYCIPMSDCTKKVSLVIVDASIRGRADADQGFSALSPCCVQLVIELLSVSTENTTPDFPTLSRREWKLYYDTITDKVRRSQCDLNKSHLTVHISLNTSELGPRASVVLTTIMNIDRCIHVVHASWETRNRHHGTGRNLKGQGGPWRGYYQGVLVRTSSFPAIGVKSWWFAERSTALLSVLNFPCVVSRHCCLPSINTTETSVISVVERGWSAIRYLRGEKSKTSIISDSEEIPK